MNFTIRNLDDKLTKVGNSINPQINYRSRILEDKGFDVKNYLNFIEKQIKERKKSRRLNVIKSSSLFNTFNKPENIKYEEYVTNTFANSPSLTKIFKRSGISFSTDLTKKNHLNTASSGYINFKNKNEYRTNNNSYYNLPTTKGTTQLIYNRNTNSKYSPTESNQNFNLYKAIK